jgi:hypothetical protein
MAEQPEELTEHTVIINGLEHTMLLSAADAKRYELAEKSKDAPNKARKASDK